MSPELTEFLNRKPKTRQEIRAWVKYFLGVTISDGCRCTGENPHNSQLDYVSGAFFNEYAAAVYMACRNGGKSAMAAVSDILDAHFKPGLRIAVTAFTREQADFVRLKIVEYLDHLKAKTGAELAVVMKDIINFTNGSVIRFFSGGKSDANVTGWRPHVLQLDEADKWPQSRVDGVANCLEGGGNIPSRFDLLSTNYTLSGDGVVLKMIERYREYNRIKPPHMLPNKVFISCLLDVLVVCDDRFKCFDEERNQRCPLWDYCKGKAKEGTGGYYRIEEAIQKVVTNSKPSFEAEYMLWRPMSEHSYFPSFSTSANVADPEIEFDPQKETFLIFDFGGKRCPHAALLVQRDKPKDRKDLVTYYVLDEFEGMGLLENLLLKIRTQYPRAFSDAQCFCDPAGNRTEQTKGASSYKQVLRQFGLWPRDRGQRRKPGFELLLALIEPASGPTKLRINKRCKNLIVQIQAAEYETKGGKSTGEPADNGKDDLLDCLRYCVGNTLGTSAKHNGAKSMTFF